MLSVRASPMSHTRTYSNSTCPLPPMSQERNSINEASSAPQYKLSRDLTNLYEVFSSTTSNIIYKNENMVCFCCEQEIIRNRQNESTATITDNNASKKDESFTSEEDRKRKVDEFIKSNKITTSLIYGSNQVRRYMKRVMTRDNWNNVLKQGFPCPHLALWNGEETISRSSSCSSKKRMSINNGTYHCSLCDTDQTQQTLRLTLTPLSCRAQDNEIYGEYQHLQKLDKERKRRGVLHMG